MGLVGVTVGVGFVDEVEVGVEIAVVVGMRSRVCDMW